MRALISVVAVASGLALFPSSVRADPVALGYLSFDVLIPGAPGNPGVDAFTVGNLTGDPATGGNDLPPDFPVASAVTFLNSTLELVSDGVTQTLNLGDIGPGFFSPVSLQFPDTTGFSFAIFTATLDSTSWQLDGGGAFSASSDVITATVLPSNGNTVAPGDFVLLIASNQTAVPEPSTLWLVLSVAPGLWWRQRRSTQLRSDPSYGSDQR